MQHHRRSYRAANKKNERTGTKGQGIAIPSHYHEKSSYATIGTLSLPAGRIYPGPSQKIFAIRDFYSKNRGESLYLSENPQR
jgi:hypothetical protein